MKLEENKNWREVPTAVVRPYRFTHHDYTEEVEKRIQSLTKKGLKYMVYGYETCPTTGRPHLQGFLFFRHEKSGKQLIKELPGTILFTCNADAIANSKYCKKEGKIGFEWGTCPMSQEGKGNSASAIMAQCIEWAQNDQEDEIMTAYPTVWMAHLNQWDKVFFKAAAKRVPDEHDGEMSGVWIIGPAGSAKSGTAREFAPNAYKKVGNKEQWQHYRYEKDVIIEDYDPTIKNMSYNMKIWTDRYKFIADLKFGSAQINPERMIVTSNYEIADCFGEDPDLLASMTRRFPTVIRMTKEDGTAWVAKKRKLQQMEDEDPNEIFGP